MYVKISFTKKATLRRQKLLSGTLSLTSGLQVSKYAPNGSVGLAFCPPPDRLVNLTERIQLF